MLQQYQTEYIRVVAQHILTEEKMDFEKENIVKTVPSE
jgi:hypothetical protein